MRGSYKPRRRHRVKLIRGEALHSAPESIFVKGHGRPKAKIGRTGFTSQYVVVPHLVSVVGEQGYRLQPSAQIYLKAILSKGLTAGRIQTPEEVVKVGVTLAAAGVEVAKSAGRKSVLVGDLRSGFHQHVRIGSGNCPPHACIRRSIILREPGVLEGKLSMLDAITTGITSGK